MLLGMFSLAQRPVNNAGGRHFGKGCGCRPYDHRRAGSVALNCTTLAKVSDPECVGEKNL
jgi:hypothetical protein